MTDTSSELRRALLDPRALAFVVLTVAVILAVIVLEQRRPMESGRPVQRIASVVAVVGGVRTKHSARYDHRVRFEDGSEAVVSLRDVFAPGTRLRLACGDRLGDHLTVFAYQPCQDDCRP